MINPLLFPGLMQNMPQQTAPGPLFSPQGAQQRQQAPNPFGGFQNALAPILMAIGADLASDRPGTGAALIPQMAQQRQDRARRNQTLEWMRSQPGMAQYVPLVESGALTAADALKMNREDARRNSPAETNWGNNPQIVGKDTDGDGQPDQFQYLQFNNRGGERLIPMPEGAEGFAPIDPFTKNFLGSRGAAEGKATGEANIALPAKQGAANDAIKQIDDILADPALDRSVGPIEGRLPSFSAGAIRFDERVSQLKGSLFLQAREQLKGGGQITDYEGQRAEVALARASQAKSETDFRQAMMEARLHLERGLQILAQQAGRAPAGAPPSPASGQRRTSSGVSWSIGQ